MSRAMATDAGRPLRELRGVRRGTAQRRAGSARRRRDRRGRRGRHPARHAHPAAARAHASSRALSSRALSSRAVEHRRAARIRRPRSAGLLGLTRPLGWGSRGCRCSGRWRQVGSALAGCWSWRGWRSQCSGWQCGAADRDRADSRTGRASQPGRDRPGRTTRRRSVPGAAASCRELRSSARGPALCRRAVTARWSQPHAAALVVAVARVHVHRRRGRRGRGRGRGLRRAAPWRHGPAAAERRRGCSRRVKPPVCTTARREGRGASGVRSQNASALGGNPFGVAVTADGKYSFVSLGNSVAVLNDDQRLGGAGRGRDDPGARGQERARRSARTASTCWLRRAAVRTSSACRRPRPADGGAVLGTLTSPRRPGGGRGRLLPGQPLRVRHPAEQRRDGRVQPA